MNKYNISPRAKQAAQLILTCVIMALCAWAVYGIVKVFSPLGGPAADTNQTRAHHLNFSSPSSEAGVDLSAPAFTFTSTMDLQRELNRRYPKLKLEVDGVYGVLTQAAHERAIGDQYAKEIR